VDFRPIDIDQVPWPRRLLLPASLPVSRLLRAVWRRSGASRSTWFDSRIWRAVWNVNRLFACTPRQKPECVEVQLTRRVRMRLDLSRLTDVLALCYGVGETEVGFVCGRLCARDATIVDVGGNIGTAALAFAEMVPDGNVHVFEPSAEMLEVLRANIALSGMNNIIVHPHGLSDAASHAHLQVAIEGNPGSAYVIEGEASGQIEISTLDEVLADQPRVDFIKIDVEGLEFKVIRGGQTLIARHKPVVLFEVNGEALRRGGTSGEEICAHLQGMGYRLFYVDRGRFEQYLPETMARRKLHNAFAVHPEGPSWSRLPRR
jgi:FkbM family methyltransferase